MNDEVTLVLGRQAAEALFTLVNNLHLSHIGEILSEYPEDVYEKVDRVMWRLYSQLATQGIVEVGE